MSETAQQNAEFEALLDFIRTDRGFDFTGYKRPGLMRRIVKQMEAKKIEGYENYRTYLQETPEEFIDLFNTILINVTAFFRDEVAWDFLREQVVDLRTPRSRAGPTDLEDRSPRVAEHAHVLRHANAGADLGELPLCPP